MKPCHESQSSGDENVNSRTWWASTERAFCAVLSSPPPSRAVLTNNPAYFPEKAPISQLLKCLFMSMVTVTSFPLLSSRVPEGLPLRRPRAISSGNTWNSDISQTGSGWFRNILTKQKPIVLLQNCEIGQSGNAAVFRWRVHLSKNIIGKCLWQLINICLSACNALDKAGRNIKEALTSFLDSFRFSLNKLLDVAPRGILVETVSIVVLVSSSQALYYKNNSNFRCHDDWASSLTMIWLRLVTRSVSLQDHECREGVLYIFFCLYLHHYLRFQ